MDCNADKTAHERAGMGEYENVAEGMDGTENEEVKVYETRAV